jgi:hypothetical protein
LSVVADHTSRGGIKNPLRQPVWPFIKQQVLIAGTERRTRHKTASSPNRVESQPVVLVDGLGKRMGRRPAVMVTFAHDAALPWPRAEAWPCPARVESSPILGEPAPGHATMPGHATTTGCGSPLGAGRGLGGSLFQARGGLGADEVTFSRSGRVHFSAPILGIGLRVEKTLLYHLVFIVEFVEGVFQLGSKLRF